MHDVLFIDFETRSACDLKKAGSHLYAAHPSTEVLCLGFAFSGEPPRIYVPGSDSHPSDVVEHVAALRPVVGHNIGGFEIPVWNEVLHKRHGWPALYVEQCRDTMAQAYACGLPGSLEGCASALGIEKQKDMAGHRIMLQLSQPKDVDEKTGAITWREDAAKFQALVNYCLQDVEVEREVYKRLPRLSEKEQVLWELDHYINRRGVYIDVRSARKAQALIEFEKERLDKEIRKVTGNAVATCTAVGQLTDWLRFRGVETEGVAKADVSALLSRQELPEDCRAALALRQEAAKSSTAKINAMLGSSGDDQRVRGTLQYHGATTGRWAGRKIQVQNFPRPSLSQKEIVDVIENIIGGIDD
jgi:DNA polymerase